MEVSVHVSSSCSGPMMRRTHRDKHGRRRCSSQGGQAARRREVGAAFTMLCISDFPCCYDKTPSSSNLKQLRGYSWLWWGSRGGCGSACGSRNSQRGLAQSCRPAAWKSVGSNPARPISWSPASLAPVNQVSQCGEPVGTFHIQTTICPQPPAFSS